MKVLFVDRWTRGVNTFGPIAAELRHAGVDCLLVHQGSWGKEPDRPDEEWIDGLLVRDIRYYRTRFIHTVLRREAPDAVLMLNTTMIADRAAILAARALGIKTAYAMHGILPVGEQRMQDMAGQAAQLRRQRFTRLAKYARHIIPDYVRSGIAESWRFPFRMDLYILLAGTFLRPERALHYPAPSRELQCDLALIWGEAYAEHVLELGYPSERVRIVGHPPLDAALRAPHDVESGNDCCDVGASRSPTVLFLEGGFVEYGVQGWTERSRLEHIEELAEAARASGRRLLVKLHPGTSGASMFQAAAEHDRWEVVQYVDLTETVRRAESVISHMSSAVMVALALSKPVFIPRWGISAAATDLYASLGVATACASPAELQAHLACPQLALEATSGARASFTRRFLGPMDGRASERIASHLVELGRSREGKPAQRRVH